jgi:hypothetical protein
MALPTVLIMETALIMDLILLIMDLPRLLPLTMAILSLSLEATLPLPNVLLALVILTMATPRHLLPITKMDLMSLTMTSRSTALKIFALRDMRVTHHHHHLLLTIPSL